jgi:TolB-like protein
MQTKHLNFLFVIASLLFITACSNTQITANRGFPAIPSTQKIALYSLNNYTDTPRAGLRAANITEGLLLAKGYQVDNKITAATRKMSLTEKITNARQHHIRYLVTGGVSEWRYKTGIDGEPAVSIQLKLIDTHNRRVVWSATGSDSSWGNTSIGVVAQNLISGMLPVASR